MPNKEFRMIETSRPVGKRVSVVEAAEYIGLSESTLNKLRMTGSGPRFLKLGRRILYDTIDLDDWLISKRRVSTGDNGPAEAAL